MTIHSPNQMPGRRTTRRSTKVALAIASFAGAAIVVAGCESEPTPTAEPATTRPAVASWWNPPKQSGVQLWAQNCQRCHNLQNPARYSDAQWGVITHHMRLRADLTGEETRLIAEFLKSGS